MSANLDHYIKPVFIYLFSLISVTTILVYVLDLPNLLTNASHLVKQYYYTNFVSSFVLDIVLVAIYLGIASYVAQLWNMQSFFSQMGVVALTTLFISGAFFLYFTNTPKTSQFFSVWFHTVKYKAVIYDILLVSSVFAVQKFLTKKLV